MSAALELRETRGRLEVRSAVVRKVATRLAQEVAGVVPRDGGAGALLGRHGSPHVELVYEGPHVDAVVRCDVTWPCDLDAVAAAVRDRVRGTTPTYAGVTLRTVDVRVRPVLTAVPRRRAS
ncbi:Asp23/Gls24 family envelope stress response protein [Nocardioidaceae bacterium]|nr:Asp23/Gls24 family envelope stress response protein [Nocardioidaceae bacterium]